MATITQQLEAGAIDFSEIAAPGRVGRVHPGAVLRGEFLEPMGITAYRLARDIGVPPNRVTGILNGKRAMTADTALRLSHYFGTSAGFWMNLQARHDLELAAIRLGRRLQKKVKIKPARDHDRGAA
jgi:antitoxin HigA-1